MLVSAANVVSSQIWIFVWLAFQCMPLVGNDLNSPHSLVWKGIFHVLMLLDRCLLGKERRGFLHLLLLLVAFGGELLISLFDLSCSMFSLIFICFQPKLHSINHGTAYCGRDTIKVLLVLLDEEAVSAPTQNKAELLYDDVNLIMFGSTSVLTLFRWVLKKFLFVYKDFILTDLKHWYFVR